MRFVATEEELVALYGTPSAAARAKISPVITPHYRAWMEASPFLVIASVGPEGLDCSARGEAGPVLRVIDERTVALPDHPGNRRIATLRNIVRDPRVALMFLVPGAAIVLRLHGRARITADPQACAAFARDGQTPRTVVFVTADAVDFQRAKPVERARLWAGGFADPSTLPSPDSMLLALDPTFDDMERPARAARG